MLTHELPDFALGLWPYAAASTKLSNEVPIPQCSSAEGGCAHLVPCEECFNVIDQCHTRAFKV